MIFMTFQAAKIVGFPPIFWLKIAAKSSLSHRRIDDWKDVPTALRRPKTGLSVKQTDLRVKKEWTPQKPTLKLGKFSLDVSQTDLSQSASPEKAATTPK